MLYNYDDFFSFFCDSLILLSDLIKIVSVVSYIELISFAIEYYQEWLNIQLGTI